MKEAEMTLLEQIQSQLRRLPPEKQSEVLDFVTFLQQRLAVSSQPSKGRSLRKHPAFGSWRGRNINALEYQQKLRAEWDGRP
jgi:mRNA-degrading endonuclease RelE of RelBE toxin-antitoxin system